ncbi:MAG TPA: hypothetical protein VNG04_09345 [Candidatus Acidoferrum sp.]|nr:hypothetical protein [Candidatus Acidoferrum sp.]
MAFERVLVVADVLDAALPDLVLRLLEPVFYVVAMAATFVDAAVEEGGS